MITKAERERLKRDIDAVGRLRVCEELGMKYATLGGKLQGFNEFFDAEVAALRAAVRKLKGRQPHGNHTATSRQQVE